METFNIQETMSIINYGVTTQTKLSELSQCAFDVINNIEINSIGVLLSEMLSFFKTTETNSFREQQERECQIDKMSNELKEKRISLLKDCELLEQFCVVNDVYKKELTDLIMYARGVEEQEAQRKKNFEDKSRFETLQKRIKELETSLAVANAFNPQIKVIQESEAQMAEKIQSTMVNVLTLWKRQSSIEQNRESLQATNEYIIKTIGELIDIQDKAILSIK